MRLVQQVLERLDRFRPQGVRAGDLVLWADRDGAPLAVTAPAPSGPRGLWAALVAATAPIPDTAEGLLEPAVEAESAARAFLDRLAA